MYTSACNEDNHHFLLFFFNDTATTEIYTLSLHDALPISPVPAIVTRGRTPWYQRVNSASENCRVPLCGDRKSTRLNSSHVRISYAVFCLKIKSNISTNRNNLISGVERCIHLNAVKNTTIS